MTEYSVHNARWVLRYNDLVTSSTEGGVREERLLLTVSLMKGVEIKVLVPMVRVVDIPPSSEFGYERSRIFGQRVECNAIDHNRQSL